ncbi:unnamed protein product [Closterium sp. Naga37s-1]|nr:unnamed protein product [Closterium sp. Naga37s-1]
MAQPLSRQPCRADRVRMLVSRVPAGLKAAGTGDHRVAMAMPAAHASAALALLEPDMARAAEDVSLPLAFLNPAYDMVAEAAPLEFSVLFLYLGGLLALLGFGTFLVVRQVLVKRELENAAKELQDRVRSGEASSEEYFELGAIMLRKKFFVVANKYLELAIAKWEGDEQELAQVYNALGFSYFSEEKLKEAVKAYEKAVSLQPAYVTAWNNLGDALERQKEWARALKAYDTALVYDPSNRIAVGRAKDLRQRVDWLRY